jgi:hypothetical protein
MPSGAILRTPDEEQIHKMLGPQIPMRSDTNGITALLAGERLRTERGTTGGARVGRSPGAGGARLGHLAQTGPVCGLSLC